MSSSEVSYIKSSTHTTLMQDYCAVLEEGVVHPDSHTPHLEDLSYPHDHIQATMPPTNTVSAAYTFVIWAWRLKRDNKIGEATASIRGKNQGHTEAKAIKEK